MKNDPVVFGAEAIKGKELNRDDERILKSDSDSPKNDLDAPASAPMSDASIDRSAEVEVMLSFSAVLSALIEGDLPTIAGASCALDGGDNFGFLYMAVPSSESCEWVRAADFSKEKHLDRSIARSDCCLRDARCVEM